MPIFEYLCKKHGKFDAYVPKRYQVFLCPKCNEESVIEEFSLTAKRNPEHGIQK